MMQTMPAEGLAQVKLCEKCHFPLHGTDHDDECERRTKMTQTTNNLKILKVYSMAIGGFGWTVDWWDGTQEIGEADSVSDAIDCVMELTCQKQ